MVFDNFSIEFTLVGSCIIKAADIAYRLPTMFGKKNREKLCSSCFDVVAHPGLRHALLKADRNMPKVHCSVNNFIVDFVN